MSFHFTAEETKLREGHSHSKWRGHLFAPDGPESKTFVLHHGTLPGGRDGVGLAGLRYTVLSLRSFPPGGEAEVHILIAQHVTGAEPVTVSGIREGRPNTTPRGGK